MTVGFERHAIAILGAVEFDLGLEEHLAAFASPRHAVERLQHGSAPVALVRGRRRTAELDTKGRRVGVGERIDLPGAHFLGQAGYGAARAGQRPERALQARKEEEQQYRERQRVQQAAAREAQRRLHASQCIGCGDHGDGTDGEPQLHEVERHAGETLSVETGCEQQEKRHRDHHEVITSCTGLEQLERAHGHEQ